jgi:hypothetical protein
MVDILLQRRSMMGYAHCTTGIQRSGGASRTKNRRAPAHCLVSESSLGPKNRTTQKSRGFFFEVKPGVNSSVIFVSERNDA